MEQGDEEERRGDEEERRGIFMTGKFAGERELRASHITFDGACMTATCKQLR